MKDEVKIILDICDKILFKNVDHHLRLNLEPNSTQFKTLKNELISSELTKLLVKEDLGGAGMTLSDIIPIVQLSAQYGTPIPFIETIISNFLLSELNIKAENDFITLTNKTENILIKKFNLFYVGRTCLYIKYYIIIIFFSKCKWGLT